MGWKKPKRKTNRPRSFLKLKMIVERVGGSQKFRDRRERRALEKDEDWEDEDWGEEESEKDSEEEEDDD